MGTWKPTTQLTPLDTTNNMNYELMKEFHGSIVINSIQ